MSNNYSNPLPRDNGSQPMQEFPAPIVAKVRYTSENATTSSVLTVGDNTVQLEIAAIGQSAAMRWVTTGDGAASIVTIAGSTSNYDHVIPGGTYRRFVIPIESFTQSSVVGANIQNGLFRRVAVKSFGIGSVMTIEY